MAIPRRGRRTAFAWMARRVSGVFGAIGFTLACFLVLPVIQAIAQQAETDTVLQTIDSAILPPPPTAPEEEPEPEPEEEEPEEVPELDEGPPPDLSMLEMALSGDGGGFSGPQVELDFGLGDSAVAQTDQLFSMAELDQVPRVLYPADPVLNAKQRKITKKAEHKVYLLFVVGSDGTVKNPRVQSSTHPDFEKPALKAIAKWRFEPGKRQGKPVAFRMRLPITFRQSK